MRGLLICSVLVTFSFTVSNTHKTIRLLNPQNKLFIITLDGFRWEEVFKGADSLLISDPTLNTDTTISKAMYWEEDPKARRKRLLPFFWNVIGRQGKIFGNRDFDNKVNVANPYALSYPGYSEILTGSVDYSIWRNEKRKNKNLNILESLNHSKSYSGKVAAFTSWDVFPFILNKGEKKNFVLNSGLQPIEDNDLTKSQSILNKLQDQLITKENATRYDELTFIACKEYILKSKPSVVLLSFSGTDNAGHEDHYDEYLQEAQNADRMIGELWRLIQAMPEYAGQTTLLITTDHGRGKKKNNWSDHGIFVPGSSQTWYALLGNRVDAQGEIKSKQQSYQKDLHALMTEILSVN